MSSHHFVKEGQEPSLLILDPISQSHADSFLEWSPLVAVHEKAVEEVLLWGIKLDIVLASLENVKTLSDRLADQAPVKIMAAANPNDLSSALWLLITLKQSAVYIMVNDPTRIFENPDLPFDHLQVNLITESIKWSRVSPSGFKKWMAAGTRLFIRGITGAQEISNLVRMEDHFEVKTEGIVQIVHPTSFWVGEDL